MDSLRKVNVALICYWSKSKIIDVILKSEVIKMPDRMLIGTRLSHVDMEKILGHPVIKIRDSLTKLIRSAGVERGVAATRRGIKWSLYEVGFEDYESLIDPRMATFIGIKHGINWLPLIGIKVCDVKNALDYVKNNYDIYAYRAGLISGVSPCIEVLNDEVKLPRKKRHC